MFRIKTICGLLFFALYILPSGAAGDEPLFSGAQYAAGNFPIFVAIGDVDGDQMPDLAVVNVGSDNISVLLGVGDGKFAPAVHYAVGNYPTSVAIGDLDGDQLPDLAVSNRDSGSVSVLLGLGDGTFAAAVDYASDVGATSVAIGDLDGDQVPDLAVATYFNDNVSVLLGFGDGTFAAAVHYAAGDSPSSVEIGDLDGDDVPDLAIANWLGDNVSILLGLGDGTFGASVNYGAGDAPESIAIGDLNGDLLPDLAVANAGSDNVSVLLGLGDGTFVAAVNNVVGDRPRSVAIGDLNDDQVPDLTLTNYESENVSVLLGLGDGTFATAVHYVAGDSPYSVAIDDLDGDLVADLAVANWIGDSVTVLLGSGDGTMGALNYATVLGPESIAISDLNGDQVFDLALPGATGVSVLMGLGDGTFSAAAVFAAGNAPTSVAIGDLDGDQVPDLAVANKVSDNVSVLLGVGDGSFAAAVDYAAGDGPESVAIGDLDGDQVPDMIVANRLGHTVAVLLGLGEGTFASPVQYAAGDKPTFIAIGDLNGDLVPDMTVADASSDVVFVWPGVGDGTFGAPLPYPVGDNPSSVAIGDLDGDQEPDLVVANNNSGTVSVLMGVKDGPFAPAVHYAAGNGSSFVAIGDLDGDLVPDLAVANGANGNVSVLLGIGDGTFAAAVKFAAGDSPRSLAIGDLDGDQAPDLVVANRSSLNVSILLHQLSGLFPPDCLEFVEIPNTIGDPGLFGYSVSIDGNTAIIGAYQTDGAATESGIAQVYERSQGGVGEWLLVATLTASDPSTNARFGQNVSLSGDVAVIGSSANKAYVFVKPPGGWVDMPGETRQLTTSIPPAGGDSFGLNVAISGDVIVAGATGADPDGVTNAGVAYVFEKPAGGWDGVTALPESAQLRASDAGDNDNFGVVSISGDVVAVGAPFNLVGGEIGAGAAYVFTKPPGGWAGTLNQTTKLTASDSTTFKVLGARMAIDGDVVVAGAPGDDEGCAGDCESGAAYVFDMPSSGWVGTSSITESAKLVAAMPDALDEYGRGVAVCGDLVFVGAPDDLGPGFGTAYVYQRDDNETPSDPNDDIWTERLLTPPGLTTGDSFGYSVACTDGLALIGSRGESAYVFDTCTNCDSPSCGNGDLDSGEECDGGVGCTCCLCDEDLEPTAPASLDCQPTCGNGNLDPGEDCDGGVGCTDCLCDVDFEPTTPSSLDCQLTCGNGTCDPGENACNCDDCGAAPCGEVPGTTCADDLDNDCDGLTDLDDPDCQSAQDCNLYLSGNINGAWRFRGDTGAAFPSPGSPGAEFVPNNSCPDFLNVKDLAVGCDGRLYGIGVQNAVFAFDENGGCEVFIPNNTENIQNLTALTFGPDCHLYLSGDMNGVYRFRGDTGAAFPSPGSSGAVFVPNNSCPDFFNVKDLAFGCDGRLYGIGSQNAVFAFDENGDCEVFIPNNSADIVNLTAVTFGPDCHLYLAGSLNGVWRFHGDTGAAFPSPGSSGAVFVPNNSCPDFFNVKDLAFGCDDRLYGIGSQNAVFAFDENGDCKVFVPNNSEDIANLTALVFDPQPPCCDGTGTGMATKTFCVEGTSTGTAYSWSLEGPDLCLLEFNATPTSAGGGPTELAEALVDSINSVGCSEKADVIPSAPGCLSVTICGATTFELSVGQAGQTPDCIVSDLGCIYNPTITEVVVEPPVRAPAPHDILKNRYISIDPSGEFGTNPSDLHIRVEIDSSEVPNLIGSGPWWATDWVNGQPPSPATCVSVLSKTKPATEPDWTGCPTVHLTGCPIVPTTTYAIAAEVAGVLSADALFDTQAKPGVKWLGDCVGNFTGPEGIPPNVWTAPNGTVNIDDVFAAIKTFINPNATNATHLSVTDVHPVLNGEQMTLLVNINDALIIIAGFQGKTWGQVADPNGGNPPNIPDLTLCP